MEQTLVLIKPDAVQRGLVGTIISRLENKGLQIAACKLMQLEDAMLDEHYSHLVDKPFFPRIKEFMRSTPIMAMVWEGLEAVHIVRSICGITNSRQAAPGTIRGDYGMSMQCNLIHASDSLETAQAEVARFFQPTEIQSYDKALATNIYASDELSK